VEYCNVACHILATLATDHEEFPELILRQSRCPDVVELQEERKVMTWFRFGGERGYTRRICGWVVYRQKTVVSNEVTI
jgi:hypothetical protein